MASRYHWLTNGVDVQFINSFPTAQPFDIALPAGAQMKRFLIHQCHFGAVSQGQGAQFLGDISLLWTIKFTSGPNLNRVIWSAHRDVPFQTEGYVPVIGNADKCYFHGGDLELGVDQKATYGTAAGGAQSLAFTYGFSTYSNLSLSGFRGEWSFVGAVLYYL
jgi:hypothetical protein